MTEFLESLNDDLRGEIDKAGFKDINGLAKSFLDTQKMVNQRVAIPGDLATSEDYDKFYKKVGRPDEAAGYELQNPEGYANEEAEASFRAKAFANGLSKKQAADMYSHIADSSVQANNAATGASQEVRDAAESQLRGVWGNDYDKHMATSAGAIERFFDDNSIDAVKSLAASNPGVAAALARIGSSIGEDNNSGNRSGVNMGGMSADEAWKAIRVHQNDPKSPYRDKSNMGHQDAIQEVAELFKIVTPNED